MFDELFSIDRSWDLNEKRIRKEAKAEGIKEGKVEGRAEGKAEGKAEERARVIAAMKAQGYSDKDIAKIFTPNS